MTTETNMVKPGILLTVETIGHTTLIQKLGVEKEKKYNERLAEHLHTLCIAHNAEKFKLSGSGLIAFFATEEGFLDFVLELRELAKTRVLDLAEFPAALRMWAHCGHFRGDFLTQSITHFNGYKAIDAFRMDKYADRHDVVISGDMSTSLMKRLIHHDIDALKQGREKLKGLDEEHTLYKLVFSEKEPRPPLLQEKMSELEKNTHTTALIGNIFTPMNTGKDLLNLNIRRGVENLAFQSFTLNEETLFLEENAFNIDLRKNSFYKAWKEHFDPLDIHRLYKNYRWAIILGLAGAGKSTLLKYIAFRECKHNREIKKNDEHRVIISLQCRHMISFDLWHCLRYGDKKKEMQPVGLPERPFNVETVLNYLTFCFLFKTSETNFNEIHLKAVERCVQKAYCRGKLTLLLDALDETRGETARITHEKKEKLVECLTLLFTETKEETRKYNRFYLTTRYSEQEKYLSGKKAAIFQPLFEMLPLDMEQLRDMAKINYGETSELYHTFDHTVWSAELTPKIGNTPLTASMALLCFHQTGLWNTQYFMYDTIFGMMLERAFIKIGKVHEVAWLYDALSLLSFNIIDISKILDQSDLLSIFQQICKDYHQRDLAETEACEWISLLEKEGILIATAPQNYIFSHTTIMEFLAARVIVKKLADPLFLDYYMTFPEFEKNLKERDITFYQSIIISLAVGSGIQCGIWLLHFLKNKTQGVEHDINRLLFFRLALKALSEFEGFIHYHSGSVALGAHPNKQEHEQIHQAVEWIYQALNRLLLSTDKTLLRKGIEAYTNIPRLCQPILLNQYVDYHVFIDTDSETLELREELLSHIIEEELKEEWRIHHLHTCGCLPPEHASSTGQTPMPGPLQQEYMGSTLTLDTPHYHPDDKNFHYYSHLTENLLLGIMGNPNLRHSGHVNCVIVSRDGQYIFSGSSDHTIKCWHMETGKEKATFTGHRNIVTSLALSPDQQMLYSGSFDHTIKCWDLQTGVAKGTFKGHHSVVTSIALTPDGQYLFSGSWDKTIKCWKVSTGEEVGCIKGHSKGVTAVAVAPDGGWLYSGSDDHTVKCWAWETGEEIRTFLGHKWKVTSLGLTPDGHYLFSGARDDTVICWDTQSGVQKRVFKGHERTITSLAISPDGQYLLTGSLDHTIKCWRLATGEEIRTFKGHHSVVTGVSITATSDILVSSSEDRTIKCWELESGKEIHGHMLQGHDGGVSCVLVSRNKELIFSGSWDKTIKGWAAQSGREIISFKGHSRNISSLVSTPDGRYLFSGSFDHKIKCWEIASGKEVRALIGHSGPVTSILLTPDARFLVSGSYDHMIKCWEIASGKEVRIFKGHEGGITTLSQTQDGAFLISGGYDNTIRYWDFQKGKLLHTFSGHQGGVTAVAMRPDGKFFYSGAEDHTICCWDLSRCIATPLKTLLGHSREINCLTISADGQHLFSSANDHNLKIWDVVTGECLRTIHLPWIVQDIYEFPGQPGYLVTANDNRTITMLGL